MCIALYEERSEREEEGMFSNMRTCFKSLSFSLPFCHCRYIAKYGRSSQYNHQGPFSQIVTPVSPQNAFNKTERKAITV